MVKQTNKDFADIQNKFKAHHLEEFGFTLDRPIVVGDVRVRAVCKTKLDNSSLLPNRQLEFKRAPKSGKVQSIYFDNKRIDSDLYNIADLEAGREVVGPAMILDDTQTLVIEPGCVAKVYESHIIVELPKAPNEKKGKLSNVQTAIEDKFTSEEESDDIDSIQLSVFGHRFMSIAEQMGHTLQKTSVSVNIKERLDFSCAIFDPSGGLVANAPHIPVHLGSMSSAVAYQQQFWKNRLEEGDVLVANHPAYGGSHLPDITVITPVFRPGTKEIIFWAASRGHHSDIGGITAGSMPPFSQFLWQEGACIQAFKVVSKGIFDHQGIEKILVTDPAEFPGCSGSRSFSDSLSDLKAQIAANNKGIQLLQSLSNEFGLSVVQKYMLGIQNNAENTVRSLLRNIALKTGAPYTLRAADQLDDGSPLKLSVVIDPKTGSAVFDFEGTGPQLLGNLNAPKSITYSAILYVLRSMISEEIPLNQGCLKPLVIKVPEASFLAPGPDAATVGGNVETSQRITDVLFQCFGAVADSQGSCNNLTFGNADFGYYETIGGGAGAGPGFHGQSGVQVHMTNTRSTDPEIFEQRYPVILREFKIRSDSGGQGEWCGGDGIIRHIEFRKPVQLSILSERRSCAPRGMAGGKNGKPGQNLWVTKSGIVRSLGGKNTVSIESGDSVIIKTPGGGGYGEYKQK